MASIAKIINTQIDDINTMYGIDKTNLVNLMGIDVEPTVEYTKLLLHFNDSYTDASSSNHSVTNNGNTFSNSTKKLGSHSTYFSGSSYLTLPDSDDWNVGSGEFTVDLWYRFTEDKFTCFVSQYTMGQNSNNGWNFAYRSDSHKLMFNYSNTGSNHTTKESAVWNPTLDTWYHLALVRSGDTYIFFADGQNIGSGALTGTIYDSSRSLFIGSNDYNFSTGGYWYPHGYMDELRIVKGVAKWTSNFTPPTSEY